MIETAELTMSTGLRIIFDLRRDSVVLIPKCIDQPCRLSLDQFQSALEQSIARRLKNKDEPVR